MENRFKVARTLHNQHGPQPTKNVASMTGITKSLIEDLESNVGKPRNVGYLTVRKLAEHYGVSSDFLLGLSNTPSVKEDVQAVCKTVGLTETAINEIKASRGWGLDVLNCFLENTDFFNLLLEVRRFATAKYRLKIAETDLMETDDDRYAKTVIDLTEEQNFRRFLAVDKYEKLQDAVVDKLISHEEFRKMVNVVGKATIKEFNIEGTKNNGKR